MPLGTQGVSRPGIGSIRGCQCLSVDPPHPHEGHPEVRFCDGQQPEPIRRQASSSSALGVDSTSPSGTTKAEGQGDAVGGRRGTEKACELEDEGADSDSSLSPHIVLPPAPQPPPQQIQPRADTSLPSCPSPSFLPRFPSPPSAEAPSRLISHTTSSTRLPQNCIMRDRSLPPLNNIEVCGSFSHSPTEY